MDDKPIVVEPGVKTSMFLVGVRQIALVVGGASMLAGMAHNHDVQGLVAYVQQDDFGTLIGTSVTIIVFVYGQLRELKAKAEALIMATNLPDEKAIVASKDRWWRRLITRIRSW